MEEKRFNVSLVLKSSTNSYKEFVWGSTSETIGYIAKSFDTIRWDWDHLGNSSEAHLILRSIQYKKPVEKKYPFVRITFWVEDTVKSNRNREGLEKLSMFLKNNGYNVSEKFQEIDIIFKVEDKDMLKNTLSSYQLQN